MAWRGPDSLSLSLYVCVFGLPVLFFLRVYTVLPHNTDNILFSFRLNPCVFAQSVESGRRSGRLDTRGRERESNNTTTACLDSAYVHGLHGHGHARARARQCPRPGYPWLIPVGNRITRQKGALAE